MHKIIWNITKKCGFRCRVCGTQSDGRRELSYGEKKKVLTEICSFKEEISELDFAGGDPLFDKESREIIREAIDILGREKVSVTTTGVGVAQLSTEEKNKYLYRCEFSLDDIGNCDSQIRGENLYSIKNLKAVQECWKYIHRLTINVPIFETETGLDDLKHLVCCINKINVENLSVNILRYMPVGKVKLCDYPKAYFPERYIDYIKQNIRSDIEVSIHCAMRGIKDINDNCGLLIKKVGIDCAGNIYMCAWAGYLQEDKERNPFYLGNALEQNFASLLKTKRAIKVQNNLKKNCKCCCIFSYLYSETHDMFSNQDPLFKSKLCN